MHGPLAVPCIAASTAVAPLHHTHDVAAIRPVQGQHGQDHARLALAHVHLDKCLGAVHELARDAVLLRPDLQLALGLKHQPLRVLVSAPRTPHRQLLRVRKAQWVTYWPARASVHLA